MSGLRKRFIELSHTITHGLITYPGLPGPVISDFLSRAESQKHYAPPTSFHIGRIDLVANTGTYLDTPFHRYSDGDDLADLSLDVLADLEGTVIRVPEGLRVIEASFLENHTLKDRAVLIHTGWSDLWGSPAYFEGHPYLTGQAARYLEQAGAILVGIDSLNIDDNQDPSRPVHTILLAGGIPIVEHMVNLDRLPDQGFKFFAVPPGIRGLGSFPVRAFALTET